MTPQELVQRLESLELIDAKVISKIRRQIEDPDKKVKPKAILSFLVKKGHLTKEQAAKLVKEIDRPKPVVHEEIEVAVPAEASYDTDDLTAQVNEVAPPKVDPQMTMEAVEVDDVDSGDIDVPVQAIEVPEVEAAVEEVIEEVVPYEAALHADPLDDGGFGEMEAASYGDEGKVDSSLGFSGKRLQKDQWATKWLYIGFGILGTLLIFGAILYVAVSRVSAEDQFKAAMTSFENSAWGDFLDKIDKYIEDNPRHENVPTAKARRVQALIAQTYEGKNWDETITRASEKLPELIDSEDNKADIIRDDLGVMLPGAALKISERALRQKTLGDMEQQLEIAYKAKDVVDNATFIPSSIRKRPIVANNLDKFNDNILKVKGLIQKENDYNAGLQQIAELGNTGKTTEAFRLYQNLTRDYGDLATRAELRKVMKAVAAKEKELVSPVASEFTTAAGDRESNQQNVVVLATKSGQMLEASREIIEPVLADGALYGIDAGNGRVVWRKWLGYETTNQPVDFDEDYILVSEQRSQDLMMVRKMDGKVLWRTEIGEDFIEPAFSPAMVVVTTTGGKVIKIDAQSGQVTAAVQLPQTANTKAMIAERDPYIYQVGYYSNIYILSADDLTCRDVYNFGHYKGSIAVPPKYWNGHLLVCVNSGERCNLHVLKPAEEGLGLERVQVINQLTKGQVTTPLTRFGRWMLLAADNGEMKILNLDPQPDAIPISKFAEEKFENQSGQRAFITNQGSQLWVAGKGIQRYRVQGALQKFNRQIVANNNDRFIAPMRVVEEGLIHVRRRQGSGMVSISAVDPNTLKEIWRTDLGGSVAGAPMMVGGQVQAVSNQGDLFLLDDNKLTNGYSDDSIRASTVIENLSFDETIKLGENEFAVVATSGRDDLVHVSGGKSRLLKLQPPANKPVCKPLAIGNDLIIASSEGPVVRVDVKNGRMLGAPFQPPVKPGSEVNWKDPVILEGQVFAIASASETGPSSVYLLDASDGKSIQKVVGIDTDAKIVSRLAKINQYLYVVLSDNNGDQIVALDSSSSLGAKGNSVLPGGYVAGPWAVGDSLLVATDTGELVCYGAGLKLKWKSEVRPVKLAGQPVLDRNNIALAYQDGVVSWLNPADGSEANGVQLGQPISAVNFVDNKLLFGGLDGTVQVWQQ